MIWATATPSGICDQYTMVMAGGAYTLYRTKDALGQATLDCGNRVLNNVALVLTDSLAESIKEPASAIADVILHEAGHTYGLEHVLGMPLEKGMTRSTIMSTTYDHNKPPQEWGTGPVSEKSYCQSGVDFPQQDSWELLLTNLGITE